MVPLRKLAKVIKRVKIKKGVMRMARKIMKVLPQLAVLVIAVSSGWTWTR